MSSSAVSQLSGSQGDARAAIRAVADAVNGVIAGKEAIVESSLIALLAGGHLLLEDIPGVGKSTLARTLAKAVGGEFRRVQFTSDLLPADVLGVNVWRPQSERFEFREGPLFGNFVLADEINRAPPRTQSALLEAMGERQISVDGHARQLPDPFMVIATQNPLEHYGTYPLPESQRDRFLLRLSMGYASDEVETELLQQAAPPRREGDARPVTSPADILTAQASVRAVFLHPDLASYAQRVVARTRTDPHIRLGVSTRGALAWVAAARARAFLHAREQVDIDDLQELAVPALAHRLLVSQGAGDEGSASAQELLRELIATIDVPR